MIDNLSEKRIFPAIDLAKSSTRREDLFLSQGEIEANFLIRKAFNGMRSDDSSRKNNRYVFTTKTNKEFS